MDYTKPFRLNTTDEPTGARGVSCVGIDLYNLNALSSWSPSSVLATSLFFID